MKAGLVILGQSFSLTQTQIQNCYCEKNKRKEYYVFLLPLVTYEVINVEYINKVAMSALMDLFIYEICLLFETKLAIHQEILLTVQNNGIFQG